MQYMTKLINIFKQLVKNFKTTKIERFPVNTLDNPVLRTRDADWGVANG